MSVTREDKAFLWKLQAVIPNAKLSFLLYIHVFLITPTDLMESLY